MNERLNTLKQQIRDHSLAEKNRKVAFDRNTALMKCRDLDEYAACAEVFNMYV